MTKAEKMKAQYNAVVELAEAAIAWYERRQDCTLTASSNDRALAADVARFADKTKVLL